MAVFSSFIFLLAIFPSLVTEKTANEIIQTFVLYPFSLQKVLQTHFIISPLFFPPLFFQLFSYSVKENGKGRNELQTYYIFHNTSVFIVRQSYGRFSGASSFSIFSFFSVFFFLVKQSSWWIQTYALNPESRERLWPRNVVLVDTAWPVILVFTHAEVTSLQGNTRIIFFRSGVSLFFMVHWTHLVQGGAGCFTREQVKKPDDLSLFLMSYIYLSDNAILPFVGILTPASSTEVQLVCQVSVW